VRSGWEWRSAEGLIEVLPPRVRATSYLFFLFFFLFFFLDVAPLNFGIGRLTSSTTVRGPGSSILDLCRFSFSVFIHSSTAARIFFGVASTEEAVRRSGKAALIGTRSMTKVSRALEKGETEGFMKVLVDAGTKQILGAAILGTGGDEAIHCILDIMYARAPFTTIQRAVHIHPTVSELIPTMLGDLKPLS
jgi:hypothetical protein